MKRLQKIFSYIGSFSIVWAFLALQITVKVDAATIISSSTASHGVYEAGKPLTLTWSIKYEDEESFKFVTLFLGNQQIATSYDGVMDIGIESLETKANVTISASSVEIFFPKLSYGDEYNFTCQVSFGKSVMAKITHVKNSISITDVKGGVFPCGDSPVKKEYFLEEGDQSFAMTLCGHPQPQLHYRIGGQEYIANSTQVIDEKQGKYKYQVTLKNVTSAQCGQRIYFKAGGFKSWQSEATITVKYTPARVEGFKILKEIGEQENCTTLEWNGQKAGNCNITYTVHLFDNQMQQLETFNTSDLQHKICKKQLQSFKHVSFANIHASVLDNVGPMLGSPIYLKQMFNSTESGVFLCGDSPVKKEYFLEEGDQSFAMTLCGHPQPKLHYRIGGQEYIANSTQVIDEKQGKYKYQVTLKNVTSSQCRQKIYFKAEGFNSWQSEATITVKYTPTRVKGFKFLKEIREQGNCTTLEWNNQIANKCNITYTVRLFDNQMQQMETFNTTSQKYKRCNNQTLFEQISFANVYASWLGDAGPKLEKPIIRSIFMANFTITKQPDIEKEEVPKERDNVMDNKDGRRIEAMSFMIPGILGILIAVLILLIFVIHYIQRLNSKSGTGEEDKEKLNKPKYEQTRRKGSYDLV